MWYFTIISNDANTLKQLTQFTLTNGEKMAISQICSTDEFGDININKMSKYNEYFELKLESKQQAKTEQEKENINMMAIDKTPMFIAYNCYCGDVIKIICEIDDSLIYKCDSNGYSPLYIARMNE